MLKLFNKQNRGSEELVSVLGLISNDLEFSKWAPILPLATRDVSSIIGSDNLDVINDYYLQDVRDDDAMGELLILAQQAIALFAWIKITPTLEAQHGNGGRAKRLGENEKAMTALEQYKDEENIRSLAYEAIDALVEHLELGEFDFWKNSAKKRAIDKLLIPCKSIFDEYYIIGSHRLFITLSPMIREIQDSSIIPIIGRTRYLLHIEGTNPMPNDLLDYIRRPLALLALKKAVERLPVEVLPSGIVQVQQMGSIKEKTKAEKEARNQVATSLGNDAKMHLNILSDIIADMNNKGVITDMYIPSSTIQTKGFTF